MVGSAVASACKRSLSALSSSALRVFGPTPMHQALVCLSRPRHPAHKFTVAGFRLIGTWRSPRIVLSPDLLPLSHWQDVIPAITADNQK